MNAAQVPTRRMKPFRNSRMAVDHFLKRDIGYLGSIPFDANMRNAVLRKTGYEKISLRAPHRYRFELRHNPSLTVPLFLI